jgi:peptidoglycan/LPS O-acetylase OafA/YrhL
MEKVNKLYFPNLTGLRAIAVLLVFFHHYNQILNLFGHRGIPIYFLDSAGEIGVLLFFVLSGFLITNLLLHEEKIAKKIDIKKFYFRRILRIWPLYYLLVFLGFFVFPYLSIPYLSAYLFEKRDFFFFFFFSANYVLFKGIVIPGIAPLWSVCVEEYFYLIWPWVIRFKKFLFGFVLLVFFFPILKYLSEMNRIDIYYFNKIFQLFPFEGMVSGGLFAYLFFNRPLLLEMFIFNKLSQLLFVSLLLFVFVTQGINFPMYRFIYSVLFSYLISNLALNKTNVLHLEFKLLNYIGEISYGIYLFHSFILFIFLFSLKKFYNDTDDFYPSNGQHILISFTILTFTILFSKIIFVYFENYFLKLKENFMVVKSTNKQ